MPDRADHCGGLEAADVMDVAGACVSGLRAFRMQAGLARADRGTE
jgi:hypothetical protein